MSLLTGSGLSHHLPQCQGLNPGYSYAEFVLNFGLQAGKLKLFPPPRLDGPEENCWGNPLQEAW